MMILPRAQAIARRLPLFIAIALTATGCATLSVSAPQPPLTVCHGCNTPYFTLKVATFQRTGSGWKHSSHFVHGETARFVVQFRSVRPMWSRGVATIMIIPDGTEMMASGTGMYARAALYLRQMHQVRNQGKYWRFIADVPLKGVRVLGNLNAAVHITSDSGGGVGGGTSFFVAER